MAKLVFFSLLVAAAVVSARVSGPRRPGQIVGGFPIDISEAPFQISLLIDGRHACGGSIISPKWILTAAHCVEDIADDQLSIRAGSSLKNAGGTVRSVSQVIRHPDWNDSTYEADYALLELESALELNGKTIVSIGMPEQDDEDPVEGTKAMVSGWGKTQNQHQSNRILRATFMPIVDRDDCQKAYHKRDLNISERMLCAGFYRGGHDSCQGDSGGPLVVEDLLVGVVSFAIGCAERGYPGVNARVSAVRDWIREESGV